VKLVGGRVEFEREAGGGTRVTVTSSYLSRPFRPERLGLAIEERLVHAFHRHVLEGTRRALRSADAAPTALPLEPAGIEAGDAG
jgi:hypothetical protein